MNVLSCAWAMVAEAVCTLVGMAVLISDQGTANERTRSGIENHSVPDEQSNAAIVQVDVIGENGIENSRRDQYSRLSNLTGAIDLCRLRTKVAYAS